MTRQSGSGSEILLLEVRCHRSLIWDRFAFVVEPSRFADFFNCNFKMVVATWAAPIAISEFCCDPSCLEATSGCNFILLLRLVLLGVVRPGWSGSGSELFFSYESVVTDR